MAKAPLFIIQSNYIPWKGYFHNIAKSSEVIILDDVQYCRRDWRNRNIIKTAYGPKWLTIPLQSKNNYAKQRICETKTTDPNWGDNHLNLIKENYHKAPYFAEIFAFLQPLYHKTKQLEYLSEINNLFIRAICQLLKIKVKIFHSTDYFSLEELQEFTANERLIKLCHITNNQQYLSGTAAKDYLDIELFKQNNIDIEWVDYSFFKPYEQLHGEFTHNVSIIDTLMMTGAIETAKIIATK